MKPLAEGLYHRGGFPRNAFNVYLMGDVLVDAATRFDGGRILRQLRGHSVRAHVLTHAHPDHQGASHEVCEKLGIPLWCGEADADAVEDPRLILDRMPKGRIGRLSYKIFAGPAHTVARRLHEGDEVAGFMVLETPGHCAGHVAYWRVSDRTLVLGDVLNNVNVFTGLPGLHEPPSIFTPDPAQNRASARKLAALRPDLVCFGHGAPLRDTAKFVRFIERLSG
jgi:glyoxylase-like metal-dependent hydrolase (beta-lactamase superfamily II)